MITETKETRLHIRISESEMESIRRAADLMKLTTSAYVRMILVADAEKRCHLADLRKKRMP